MGSPCEFLPTEPRTMHTPRVDMVEQCLADDPYICRIHGTVLFPPCPADQLPRMSPGRRLFARAVEDQVRQVQITATDDEVISETRRNLTPRGY